MRRLKFENFYISSSLFSILSLLGAGLNYALYPVLAHLFNATDFGDFTALLALSNQVLGVLLAFNLTSIYLVKKYPEREAREKAQAIQKVLIWFFLGVTLLLLILSPLVNHLLNITDPTSFIALALLLISAVPAVIWTGYLQGHRRLIAVGLFTLLSSLFKFVFAIIFANVGGVRGGVFGVLFGSLLGLVALRLIARVRLPSLSAIFMTLTKPERIFMRELRLYILGSIIIVGMLSVLQNIDITFAKTLFTPSIAGVYSGISILSNALYYVSFLLIWILLPEVAIDNPVHNRRLLKTSYKLLGLIALGATLTELALGGLLTQILLGDSFKSQSSLLIFASLFQLALVAITLYAYYLLVLRKKRVIVLGASVFLSAVTFPWLFGVSSPHALIITLLGAVLFGWAIYGIFGVVANTLEFRKFKTQ